MTSFLFLVRFAFALPFALLLLQNQNNKNNNEHQHHCYYLAAAATETPSRHLHLQSHHSSSFWKNSQHSQSFQRAARNTHSSSSSPFPLLLPLPRSLSLLVLRGGSQTNHNNHKDVAAAVTPSSSLSSLSSSIIAAPFPSTEEMMEMAPKILTTLFGVQTGMYGFLLGFTPDLVVGTPEDDLSEYAVEAIGCHTLEFGVTGYLALVAAAASSAASPEESTKQRMTVEKAIGYGSLVDVYFLSKNLLNGQFMEFGEGIRNFLVVANIVTAACSYELLTNRFGQITPLHTAVKILTLLPAVKGIMVYVHPIGSGRKMLGTDLSENAKAKAFYRLTGVMKISSAILRGALAMGVKPLKAVGIANLLQGIMMTELTVNRKQIQDFSSDDNDNKNNNNNTKGKIITNTAMALLMGGLFIFISE